MGHKIKKIKISKEWLLENDIPDGNSIKDDIIENSRWSILHEVIFTYTDGKTYSTSYSVGATEQQDERPWEYDEDEIDCFEVRQVEKVVKVWETVEEN